MRNGEVLGDAGVIRFCPRGVYIATPPPSQIIRKNSSLTPKFVECDLHVDRYTGLHDKLYTSYTRPVRVTDETGLTP